MSGAVRTVRRCACGTLVSVAALAAVAAPAALAHYTFVYHGQDLVSIASDHRTASACDRESDGNLVYGDLILANGNRVRVWDSFDSVCSTRNVGSPIRDFRLCEETVGCTAWKNA